MYCICTVKGAPRGDEEMKVLRVSEEYPNVECSGEDGGRPGGAVVVKSTGGDWCKDFCTFWSILRFNFFSGRGV